MSFQLSRKSSQDSSSSKNKESKSNNISAAAAPPPPPPNTAKPLPQPGSAVAGLNSVANSNHAVPSQTPSSSIRSSSSTTIAPSTPDRRYSGDNGSPAPTIVVVNSDISSEPAHRTGHFGGSPERHALGLDHGVGNATPPRATTLNRLRAGPRDTIPIVGKPPRKQRSSRFVVTEKVDIERLPPFMGECFLFGHRL